MTSAPATKPTKRQELGARSRDEILNAALTSMSVYGYDGTSVARIASESGLPSSSIYWHFGSKAGVLAAVMERGAERFFRDSVAGLEFRTDSTRRREMLRTALHQARSAVESNPEFLRLLFLLTLSNTHDESIERVVREVTERGKAQMFGLIRFVFSDHGEDIATQVAEELVDFGQGVFDGMFMTLQTHQGVSYFGLIEHMADSILALGDEAVAVSLSGDSSRHVESP